MLKVPKCMICSRYKIEKGKEVCEAFPDGIPDDIMWDDIDQECNNGVKFEGEIKG